MSFNVKSKKSGNKKLTVVKNDPLKKMNGDFTKMVTEHLSKKGDKLTGFESKADKKLVKLGTRFHTYNKKGVAKSTLVMGDDDYMYDKLTGERVFNPDTFTRDYAEVKDEINNVRDAAREVLNIGAFLSEALDTDNQTKQLMSVSRVLLDNGIKATKKLVKAAQKQDKMESKKKKKKGGRGRRGNSTFSSWKYQK